MALGFPPDYNSLLGVQPDMWKFINTDETIKQIMADAQVAHAQQLSVAGVQSLPSPIEPPRVPIGVQVKQRQATRARELFINRMVGVRGNFRLKEDDLIVCHIHADTVLMFYCFDGRDGIVKEPMDLWPSDGLLAQFRMILA